jgi:NAD(P)-binding Rossmann-like domain
MSYVSYHAKWARRILRHHLAKEIPLVLQKTNRDLFGRGFQAPSVGTPLDPDNLPEASVPLKSIKGPKIDGEWKVCIVGAGVAGLYIAMILDDLAIPDLSYDILESSSRVGGRLYTYRFSSGSSDYVDIGAMRYPKASHPISNPAIR